MKINFLNKKMYLVIISFMICNIFLVSSVFANEAVVKNEEVKINNEISQEKEKISSEKVDNNKEIIDIKSKEGMYKLSDDNEEIYLPFVRYVQDRIVFDKEISTMGASFSGKTIEVNSPLKNTQFLFAGDSVRINAEMERPIIFTGSDVVIDSEITDTIIIFASNSVTLTENAKINKDIICFATNFESKGIIKGSLIGAFDKVDISGTIEKDLRANVNEISIASKDNIEGHILLKTYNEALSIKDSYPNAQIEILKNQASKIDITSILLKAITTCLMFTLIFVLINKFSKNKFIDKVLVKTKNSLSVVLISGIILIFTIPMISVILFILMIVGLSVVALPIFIVYMAFIAFASLLSVFIVGTVLFSYIKEKYLKNNNIGYDIIGVFCVYATLYALSNAPFIGFIVGLALVIFSSGILFTLIFKKEKTIGNENI